MDTLRFLIMVVVILSILWLLDIEKRITLQNFQIQQQAEEIKQLKCLHFEVSYNGQDWFAVSISQDEPKFVRVVQSCTPLNNLPSSPTR